MSNFTKSAVPNEDYFTALFNENHVSRLCFLAFAILTTLIGPFVLYCVIWYEKFGSDNKRTLINMLATLSCWTVIEILLAVEIPEIFRYVYGPLNPTFCHIHQFLRSRLYSDLLLQLDAVAIVRYISIFWLKNPAGLKDEFWIVFLNLFLKTFNIMTNFAWYFLTPRQPVGYYICTGQDPSEDYKESLKVYAITELCSVLLHLVVNLKIHLYKRRKNSNGEHNKFDRSKSFASFTINLIGYIFLITAFLNMIKLSGTEPKDLQNYPNYLFVYFRSLAMPGVGTIIVFSMFFTRHSGLRRLIYGELKHLVNSFNS